MAEFCTCRSCGKLKPVVEFSNRRKRQVCVICEAEEARPGTSPALAALNANRRYSRQSRTLQSDRKKAEIRQRTIVKWGVAVAEVLETLGRYEEDA